jgi:hypothetical protein
VLPWRRLLNAGSIVMTSGSTYVIGGADGEKSRGGLVTVLAGSPGFPGAGAWALAADGTKTAAPAPAPTARMNLRREIALLVLRRPDSEAMIALPSEAG